MKGTSQNGLNFVFLLHVSTCLAIAVEVGRIVLLMSHYATEIARQTILQIVQYINKDTIDYRFCFGDKFDGIVSIPAYLSDVTGKKILM